LKTYVAKSEEEDVAQIFLDWLENDVKAIFDNYFRKEMIYGEKKETEYNASNRCHICGEGGFDRVHTDKGLLKVSDHCHFTKTIQRCSAL